MGAPLESQYGLQKPGELLTMSWLAYVRRQLVSLETRQLW
jgi:hypothetical protein